MTYDKLLRELLRATTSREMLALVRRRRARWDEAALNTLRHEAFGPELKGPYDGDKIFALAQLLAALGVYEFEQQNLAHACDFYAEAAEVYKAFHDPVPRAYVLCDLALCCFHREQLEQAIAHWQEALAILTQTHTLTPARPEIAVPGTQQMLSWIEILRYLGTAFEKLGRPEETLRYWQQALDLATAAHLPERCGWIATDYGNFQRKYWRFAEALPHDRAALAFHRQQGNLRQEGLTLHFLGLSHSHLGQVAEAIAAFEAALRLARKLGDKEEERNGLGNLGKVFAQSGQLEKALAYFYEARQVMTGVPSQDEEALIKLDASIGNVFRDLGQPRKAIAPYEAAWRLAQATHNRTMENRLLSSLGIVHRDLDELEQAQARFKESLEIAQAAGDELGLGDALGNLGNLLYQQGRFTEAKPWYEQALAQARKLQDFTFVSRWQGNLGNVYRALGSRQPEQQQELWRRAEQCYLAALQTAEANRDLEHLHLWNYNLGSLHYRDFGNLETAYQRYQRAIGALQALRREIKRDEFSRSFGENRVSVYQDMVNVCLKLAGHRNEAIAFAEQGKGYTLLRLLAKAHLQPSARVPHALREEFLRLRRQQALLESQLGAPGREESRRVKAPEFFQQLYRDLEGVYAAQQKNLVQIAQAEPEFAEIFHPQPVAPEHLQEHAAAYRQKTALIELFATRDELVVFVATAVRFAILQLPEVKEHELRLFFDENWYRPYADYLQKGGDRRWQAVIAGIGAKLRDLFWRRVQEELAGLAVERIIIVPHLGLHLLPFHLIPLAEVGADDFSSSPELLLDRYEIAYAPSFRVLNYCRQARRSGPQTHSLFAVADPDRSLAFADLETLAIASFFDNAGLLFHEQARREEILSKIENCEAIHFATHGAGATMLADPLDACLVIADPDPLTAREIFQKMKLPQSRAVVLSACETGMIELDWGDEYVGLPAAFLHAGAPCVISSLWQVDDVSTALLMYRFYENRIRHNWQPGAALRGAQQWLSKATAAEIVAALQSMVARTESVAGRDRRAAKILAGRHAEFEKEIDKLAARAAPPFAAPYYWGGFTLCGNPE